MKIACVEALAGLARATTPETVAAAYGLEELVFGPEYLIPKPFDPRLIVELPTAVAKAAMDSGVATRPLADPAAYRRGLQQRVFRSGLIMRPMFEQAGRSPQRLVYADGEEERVLRAVQVVLEERLARPILIGRPEVVESRIERLGLNIRPGRDFELVNPNSDPRYNDYVAFYLDRMGRRGVTPQAARELVRTRRTVIAAVMLARGEADAMLAGPVGRFSANLRARPGRDRPPARGARGLDRPHPGPRDRRPVPRRHPVGFDPSPSSSARPRCAPRTWCASSASSPRWRCSRHSNFGSADTPSAAQDARRPGHLIREAAPDARGRRRDAGRHRPLAGRPRPQPARDRASPARRTS